MPVSEVRRMSKIKRGILFIVILAVFLVTSSVGMEYYVVHQLNGEVTGRNRPFAALTVEPEDTLDLLVAGDSESYNSVSTMRLWEDKGIAAFPPIIAVAIFPQPTNPIFMSVKPPVLFYKLSNSLNQV